MGWNKDTDFKVIFTEKAEKQAQQILDYIAYELENMQAALSVEQDMKDTAARLSYMAGSLKLCDDADLRALGYRTIHFRRHRYFMLYKVVDDCAYILGIYHDLQDYENILR